MSQARGYGSMEYSSDPFEASPSRNVRTASWSNFNTLSDEIGVYLFQINNGASLLDRALKQIGTEKDNLELRDKIHDTQQNTNRTVVNATASLKKLNTFVESSTDKHQKLHLERLRNEFRETIQRYNSLQKKVADKVKSTINLISTTGAFSGGEGDSGDEHTSLIADEERRQQLLNQQREIEFDKELLIEREQRIRQLEADILDVNEIFRDLGTMVYEQKAAVDTIEANVESATGNVKAGGEQLIKASKYQKSSRKKLCILVVIIVIIGVILAVILATQLK